MSTLEPLPASDDEYFTQYDADTQQFNIKENNQCKHHFVRTSGTECECTKCNIGFFVTPEYRVTDGHIYYKEKFMI
jgi:hypothetical protein